MKKRVIWIIVLALVSAYSLLTWVQYQYYDRVLTQRKESIRGLMKDALSDVAEELQVRELVRKLNKGANRLMGSFLTDTTFAGTDVAPFDIWVRTLADTLAVERAIADHQVMVRVPNTGDKSRVDYRPSKDLILAYFTQLHALDKYILKYVYDTYMPDSMSQMVNVYLLRSLIRERLDNKDLCVNYQMALYDYDGRVVYEYRPPGVMRGEWEDENTVTQYLFVPTDGSTDRRPYMRVSLDLAPTRAEVFRLALPSFISTIIVLLLGFSALAVLLKYISFASQRTNFINNMTHELKTPVSSIVLSTKLLEESASPTTTLSKQRQLMSIISLEAQRLKFLIDKVLQLSILDGHAGKFPLEILDVNELILPVAEIYTFHAQQRGGDLTLDLEAVNTWVRANQVHLSNVFFNLLDNAVKYSRPDVPLHLSIHTSDEGDYIRIVVQDNGIGMEKQELKRIFERFYRVGSGKRHDVRGFGLGLAYVLSVIRQIGGRITAESEPGVGTKMIIRLPVAPDA